MKKVLRFLLILIVILLVVYLILCAVSPSEMEVKRSVTINAPKEMVWNQMSNLKYNDDWNPWKKMDSTLNTVVTGPEGQPGQKAEWTSNNIGSGKMTITEVDGYTMKYDLEFFDPRPGTAKCWVSVEGEDGNVTATQYFKGNEKLSFFMRGATVLAIKPFMESQFDIGLQMLKENCESGKAEMPGPKYDIQNATFTANTFATIRKTIAISDIDKFFGESAAELGKAAGSQATGPIHAIMYKWDESNGQADMAVALPVSGEVKGMTMVTIPESTGYVLKLKGAYSGMYPAHMAIGTHAGQNGLTDPLVIEEYVAMAPQVTDSNQFVTNIYYLKK